jgi:hypothetical protein
VKAWSVSVKHDRKFDHIAWGESAGKVRYKEFLSAKDAGYDFTFADIRIKRAPWCDTTELQDKANRSSRS